MRERLLSLAAGTLPEFTPTETLFAAAEAGFGGCGIWFEASAWSAATTRKVAAGFMETRLVPLDIEVVWINPGDPEVHPDHQRLIEAGGEIGAKNVLIVSSEPDPSTTRRQFERLCSLAEAAGMHACLEFLPITEVKSLRDALAVLRDVGHPNARILVDPTHLARTGGKPADVAAIDPALISYAQFCDGVASLADPASFEALLADAVDGRLLPGEGAFPLEDLLAALPENLPLSLEIRSKSLREHFPDPVERAKAVFEATQPYVA